MEGLEGFEARHQPMRTCVGCSTKRPQREMLRIAACEGLAPLLDLRYRAPGRGVYLCRRITCVERAWGRRALERSLKLKNAAPTALQALKSEIKTEITRTSKE